MMYKNFKFSMKGTHRKLYPRWAFPFDFSSSQPNVAEGLIGAYKHMLLLIQEKAVRRKDFGSLPPYPQSSARMTPYPRITLAGDEPHKKCDLGLFAGNLIAIENKFPAVTIPALHLPASCSDPRQVHIDAYEDDIFADTGHLAFNGKPVVLASSLLNFRRIDAKTELHELQETFWHTMSFRDYKKPEDGQYMAFYRTAEHTMKPNPYILEIWRKLHGEEYGDFPWRGDVFIIRTDGSIKFNELRPRWIEISESCMYLIDDSACLKLLERHFEGKGAEYLTKTVKRTADHTKGLWANWHDARYVNH
ncbi:hypothetical protein GGI43DRAFT_257768 [Trichoderma evansii]